MAHKSWTCYHCGEAVEEGAESCPACKDSLVELCACGTTRSTIQKACPKCDRRIRRRKFTGRRRYLLRRFKRPLIALVVLIVVALLAWNIKMMIPVPQGERIAADLAAAEDAIGRKNPRKAEILLLKVLELSPQNARAMEFLAIALQDLGRYDDSVEMARRAVSLDKTRRTARLIVAGDELRQGRYVEARNEALIALETGTGGTANVAAYMLLGRIESGVGDVAKAIEYYKLAGAESSQMPDALLALGDLYMAHPRGAWKREARISYGQALSRCNVLIETDQNDPDLYWQRARARVGMGEYEDFTAAVKDLQKVAAIRNGRGEDPLPARLMVIQIYSESMGRPESLREAKRLAKELVLQLPEPRTYLAQARVHVLAEEPEEVRAALRKGIDAYPRNGQLRAALVMHLIAAGDLEAAREAATLGAAETSGNPEICVAQARVFETLAEKTSDDEEKRALLASAADAYVLALKEVPQDVGLRRRVVALLLPGILRRGGGEGPVVTESPAEEVALESVELILKLRPGDPRSSYWRGRLRLRVAKLAEEYRAAAADLDVAGHAYPRSVEIHLWRGQAHAKAAAPRIAARAFLFAARALPARINGAAGGTIYSLLARARLEANYLDGVIESCDEALGRWPEFPERRRIILTKAKALSRLRWFPQALEAATAAYALQPDDVEGILVLAGALEGTEQFEEARRRFVEAVARQPDLETQDALALFLKRRGDIAGADKIFQDLLVKEPGSTKVKLRYGDYLRQSGRRDEAVAVFREATARDPASVMARVSLADALLSGKKAEEIDEARKLIGMTREDSPEHPEGMLLAAKVELIDGRPQPAHDLLRSALSRQPRNAQALYYYALSLVRLGRVRDARAPLERALAYEPNLGQARLLLARIELQEGYLAYREHRSEQAGEAFKKALAYDPSLRFARVLLADTYLDRNMQQLSIEEVRDLLSGIPDDGSVQATRDRAAAYFLLGIAASRAAKKEDETYDEDQLDEAINAFREVARLEPDNWRGHFQLGQAYSHKKAHEMALAAYADAYRLAPSLPVIVFATVKTLMTKGDTEQALNLLVNETERTTDVAEFAHMLGDVLRQIGQPDGALQAYKKARERDNTDIEAILTPARMLHRKGRRDAAIDLVRKWIPRVAAKGGNHATLHRWLGEVAFQQGDHNEAISRLNQALDAGEKDPLAAIRLGQALERRKDLDGAIKALELAVKMGADDYRTQGKLGGLLLESGDSAGAVSRFERVLEALPDDLDVRNNLALALADANRDLDRAHELAESVLAARPDDPSAKDTLGWILLRRGEPEKALPLFNEALRRLPANAEINYHRAIAWTMTGNQERGREELRRLQTSGVSGALERKIRRALAGR